MEAISGAEAFEGLPRALPEQAAAATVSTTFLAAQELRVHYGENEIVKGVSLSWARGSVGSLIGPSGCGKTTLLRTLNRMIELEPSSRVEGRVMLDGTDVLRQPEHEVRRRVGMVFQRPNPFPMSIFDNIAYALRDQGSFRPRRRALAERVEQVLTRAGLWDEVKDDLKRSALRLSGGQQQRLCIARVLAVGPDVVLMDEPCASLDPQSTLRIEELILELRKELALVVVTHNLAQAKRISDRAAFLLMGEVVEQGDAEQLFTRPSERATEDFIAGVFG